MIVKYNYLPFWLLTIVTILLTKTSYAQCHIDDWTALNTLYESTDGDNWENNFGWQELTNNPPPNCNLEILFGVGLDAQGRVDSLHLYSNQLSGSLPGELSNLTNLYWLRLASNQLSGNLPAELGNLTKLRYLYLHVNQLSGSLPAELGNLTNLEGLWLYNNQFSGSLPAELGNLTKLTGLSLSVNQFSGSLPVELGNLTNLERLYLNYNQFSSSLPAELCDLTNLTKLVINDNNLQGCYPVCMNVFCTQLTNGSFDGNSNISNGNNFDTTWEDFCVTGTCICVSNLIIDTNTPFQNLYQSQNTIVTQGTVIINPNQQAEYNSNRITLNIDFKAQAGCEFKVRNDGCY